MTKLRKRLVHMKGWSRTLSSGAIVMLAYREGHDEDGVTLQFKRGCKTKTVSLSREAMEAVSDHWKNFVKYTTSLRDLANVASEIRLRIVWRGPTCPNGYAGIPPIEDVSGWYKARLGATTESQWTYVPPPAQLSQDAVGADGS